MWESAIISSAPRGKWKVWLSGCTRPCFRAPVVTLAQAVPKPYMLCWTWWQIGGCQDQLWFLNEAGWEGRSPRTEQTLQHIHRKKMLENKEGYYPVQAWAAQPSQFHLKQVPKEHVLFPNSHGRKRCGLPLVRGGLKVWRQFCCEACRAVPRSWEELVIISPHWQWSLQMRAPHPTRWRRRQWTPPPLAGGNTIVQLTLKNKRETV